MRSHGHQKPLATSGAKTSAFFVVPGMGGNDSIPATVTLELELHYRHTLERQMALWTFTA
jgi:hypothetical protein